MVNASASQIHDWRAAIDAGTHHNDTAIIGIIGWIGDARFRRVVLARDVPVVVPYLRE